ncbi:MAG: efflux RND transporter periplasmic adaptor subunit [Bryobacteraceae bacterium]|jgi:cobalt-zinc-cadmium efflux system membrane fusion protein
MNRTFFVEAIVCVAFGLALAGCSGPVSANSAAEAPPPATVEPAPDSSIARVDHPERFPVAAAGEHVSAPDLKATGVVSPDVSRNIPVISLASGRVVDIRARIGDTVTKDQLLMSVQSSDVAQAFSDYQQAMADETLARVQFERAKLLLDRGAIAQKDLEVAEDAAAKAAVTVQTAKTRLRLLGADADHPSARIDIYAPASGVITEQNVTASAGVKTLDNSPNLFTISDLSEVWILCDVYENDLRFVRIGEFADVRLSAYPGLVLKARIGNISPILDPSIRTAKVRLEVHNRGLLRLGMFVSATFHGMDRVSHATVPATAVLHLHDRDWVYVPIGGGQFRRLEVVAGNMLPGGIEEILSGIGPGQQVVENALVLQNTVEQ